MYEMPDRNGKIFYTSITSLSHISKKPGHEAAYGRGRRRADRRHPCSPAFSTFRIMPKTNTTRRALSETGGRGKGGINF